MFEGLSRWDIIKSIGGAFLAAPIIYAAVVAFIFLAGYPASM